jgi:hypothetical protein
MLWPGAGGMLAISVSEGVQCSCPMVHDYVHHICNRTACKGHPCLGSLSQVP